MTEAVYEGEYEGPELELASQGRRLGGFILDIILFTVTLGIGWTIWYLAVAFRGRSPAKQILGMHVVRGDGNPAHLGWMLLRDLVIRGGIYVGLSYLFGLVLSSTGNYVALGVLALAALWCVWDANRQCLWDKVVGTYVVRQVEGPAGARVVSPTERAAENLETLQDLHARGLLTDEEYEERRAREIERL